MHSKTTRIILALSILLNAILASILLRPENISNNFANPNSQASEAGLIFGFIENEALPVEDCLVYRGFDSADTTQISDLIREGALIFRFSGNACSNCIEFALEKIRTAFPDMSKNDRLILIASHIPERLKGIYYGKPVYTICDIDKEFIFDRYDIPYMFYLDSDLEYKHFFVPEMTNPGLTDFYLSTIKNRYFN